MGTKGYSLLAILLLLALPHLCGAAPHSTYAGFAQPVASYSMSTRNVTFANDAEQKAVSVSVSDYAVYRKAYVSMDGRSWQNVTLSGKSLGGDWLNGSVAGQVLLTAANFSLTQSRLSTQRNFMVVYTCSRSGNAWDCHSGWQIWQFNASMQQQDPCSGMQCDDGNPCTADSCSGGQCSHMGVGCIGGDGCCPAGCTSANDGDCAAPPDSKQINVVGPHEFWTHTNAVDQDYVGYVKYFDMTDFTPAFSLVSGNNGAFRIDQSTGLITVAGSSLLKAGATHTLGVRIRNSAGTKDSTASVIIHVADGNDVTYFDGRAPDGGDGSYDSPYNQLEYDIGTFTRGIYLLKRGTVIGDTIFVADPLSSLSDPIVIGAYGQGSRPVMDGSGTGTDVTGLYIGNYRSSSGTAPTGYVYVQNIEISNWGMHGISNGNIGHHHLTFLDVYVHHSRGGSTNWWMWEGWEDSDAGILKPNQDLDIIIVNCESAYAAESGTKWSSGGLEAYNFISHDNGGNGLRMISAEGKTCKGCLIYDNTFAGIQLRADDTLLRYFKVYGNTGIAGIMIEHAFGLDDPYQYVRDGFDIRDGVVHGTNGEGIRILDAVSGIHVNNVKIHDNGWSGVGIYAGDGDVTENISITNSEIYGNARKGINTGGNPGILGDVLIEGNEIHGNGEASVYLEYVDGAIIRDNVFYGNGANTPVIGTQATNVQQSGNQYP